MSREKWPDCDQTLRFRVRGRKVKGFTQRRSGGDAEGADKKRSEKLRREELEPVANHETRNVLASLGVGGGAILFVH